MNLTERRARLLAVLRRPGLPAAGDYARLLLRIADRRAREDAALDLRRAVDVRRA